MQTEFKNTMLELQRSLHLKGSKPHVSMRENRWAEHMLRSGEKVFKATLLKKTRWYQILECVIWQVALGEHVVSVDSGRDKRELHLSTNHPLHSTSW